MLRRLQNTLRAETRHHNLMRMRIRTQLRRSTTTKKEKGYIRNVLFFCLSVLKIHYLETLLAQYFQVVLSIQYSVYTITP